MKKQSYTTAQVAEAVGVPLRKVISYVERGFVSPSIRDALGHGSKREWSYSDVVRCAVVTFLQDQVTVDFLRDLATYMEDDRVISDDFLWLVHYGPPLARRIPRTLSVVRVRKSQGYVFARGEPAEMSLQELLMAYPAQLMLNFEAFHELVASKLGIG